MDTRLLGPFEVVVDEVVQKLPGRGERALLALLALSAGRVVAATSLIDQLWLPEELPEDPANALQLRVSKLRRALQALGGGAVVRRDGAGYRLDADAATVDERCAGELGPHALVHWRWTSASVSAAARSRACLRARKSVRPRRRGLPAPC
jgi:DNA-binding SARP family transcriptional activator